MTDMEKHPDRIAEQAAEHFARRHGASLPERRERDVWLSADPAHAKAYDGIQRLWDQSGNLADDQQLQALKDADQASLRRRRWPRPQRFVAMAATLVILVGAGYLASQRMPPPPPLTFATTLGERRTETMPDGSRVVLNTDSAIEVRYSNGRRAIALTRGEAQFDVARDASRPFVVNVDEDSVTALGTRFQVRRESDSTLVTLFEGSVELAHGDQRHVLKPNEQAVLSTRTGIAIASVDAELASGWLDGWLRFRGAPLAEVIVEANHYSELKLRLGDPRLAHVQLSGNFHVGDNESLAASLELILPVRAQRNHDSIVLLPR